MKNVKFLVLPMMAFAMVSCGNDKPADASAPTSSTETSAATTETNASSESGQYDPKRGLGKYDESNVDVSKFDAAMAAEQQPRAEGVAQPLGVQHAAGGGGPAVRRAGGQGTDWPDPVVGGAILAGVSQNPPRTVAIEG